MAFNELKYTQSVWGYQEVKRKFWLEGENRVLSLYLRPPDAHCPKCKSRNVRANKHRERTLIGLPNGKCQVRFVVPIRKVVCRDCRAVTYERVAFAAYKNARITRSLAKKLLARAAEAVGTDPGAGTGLSLQHLVPAAPPGTVPAAPPPDAGTKACVSPPEPRICYNTQYSNSPNEEDAQEEHKEDVPAAGLPT